MVRKLLTREEMWRAIRSKYKTLDAFSINCRFKQYHSYINRTELFNILIDMKLHTSRHLKKHQKNKVRYELRLKELNKILVKI